MGSPYPPLPNPLVITAAGVQPQPPATLRARLDAYVSSFNPGYTSTLPASMIEDMASTAVGAIALCDQAWVDLANSLNPLYANPYLLLQLGQIYGPIPNQPTNTSVNVVISGNPGYVIPPGFIVGDGTYQYIVQSPGGVIASNGSTAPLYAIATVPGTWAVPEGTVVDILTSVPSQYTLSATNPLAGTPGDPNVETEESYRARVVQAGLATAVGTPAFLKTMLGEVTGVQQRLIGVRLNNGEWEVIVGGGDPYQVAYAIFLGLGAGIANLTGSTLGVLGITKANPGVVTTDLNHGYTTGQMIEMTGVEGMTEVNGVPYTATVLSPTIFSIGIDTSGYSTWTGGGVVTPNLRNIAVDILNFPDTYQIPVVLPPQETVTIVVTWNTTATNLTSNAAVATLAIPALVDYINSVFVGQPINLFELQATFQQAVASLIPTEILTRMVFSVSINGIGVEPEEGTGIIAGDPESYLFTSQANITVQQG